MAQALSHAGQHGREQDSQLHISPWHQPFVGVGFVSTNAASKSHFFLVLQVTQSTCWVQQLIGMCSLLLLLLQRDGSWFRRMKALSSPLNQMAKQFLDRGEHLWVTLTSSPRAAATKQPHPASIYLHLQSVAKLFCHV